MNKLTEKEHEAVFLRQTQLHPETCGKCFCNDLCLFLLMETGVATTCKDFQRRVKKVVDREVNK